MSVLGAPTRDRPRALRRAIEGYARDIAEHGRAIEIVIVDDGVTSSGETATVAREVARRFGVRVRLIDRPARVLLAKAVADRAGAPLPIVERALAPHAPDLFAAGAARNVLLLAGVDRGLLQIDDDTVCDLRAAPDARPGLRARSFEDPTEMWFDEHEMASKQGESANAPAALPGPLGYASAHEQLLGRSATSLILSAMARGEADLAGASPSLLLRAARGGRARCTQIGVRGHSALGTMVYLLTIGEPTRGRLLASEATYRASIASRRLLRAVPAATLTDVDACMTYGIGLDARSLLPPFPPVERNEDGLFGVMLAACDPTAFFGHLPFTIGHEPEDARPSRFDLVFEQVGRVGVNDVIAGLVSASHHEIDHRSPAAAQESLGRALLAWTELPEDELFERITWMLARRLAQRLARIAALLRESRREPLYWARDLERLADVLRERVEDPERAVPFELAARHAGSMARGLAVRRIREYAEILTWWPAVWEAARALRARGDAVGDVYT